MSQRIFPAIKSLKNGHLPDFNEQGEMIEVQDDTVVESQQFPCLDL